jgi:peptidoglycan-N-acetylglucosamine deacetylase
MRVFYHVRIRRKRFYGLLLLIILLLLAYLIQDQVLRFAFQADSAATLYCIDTREKILVFTFEVSAGEDYLEEILDTLSRHGIRAVFFVTGRWVKENPGLTRRLSSRHELGNHSYSHPRLEELSDRELAEEFSRFQEALQEAVPGTSVPYFRPPFGDYDERAQSLALEAGQLPVLWSIESRDWLASSLDQYLDDFLGKVHPGGIVVFRAGSEETLMALPLLIQALWQEGYSIVSLETALKNSGGGI